MQRRLLPLGAKVIGRRPASARLLLGGAWVSPLSPWRPGDPGGWAAFPELRSARCKHHWPAHGGRAGAEAPFPARSARCAPDHAGDPEAPAAPGRGAREGPQRGTQARAGAAPGAGPGRAQGPRAQAATRAARGPGAGMSQPQDTVTASTSRRRRARGRAASAPPRAQSRPARRASQWNGFRRTCPPPRRPGGSGPRPRPASPAARRAHPGRPR